MESYFRGVKNADVINKVERTITNYMATIKIRFLSRVNNFFLLIRIFERAYTHYAI